MRKCLRCKISIEKRHPNAKRCKSCAQHLVKYPAGCLSEKQEGLVRKFAGTMYINDLAKKVGTSNSNLDRWARDNGVNINAHKYRPEVVAAVTAYYERHGKSKTQKRFPDVRVRSIVEKYRCFEKRQRRWTEDEKLDLIRFAGIVPLKIQAKYFNRPRANSGSIISAWSKTLGQISSRHGIHGMYSWKAEHFVKSKCPWISVGGLTRETKKNQRLFLWVDMEKNLRDDCPSFVQEAVSAMAHFQRELFNAKNAGLRIRRMRQELLNKYGK